MYLGSWNRVSRTGRMQGSMFQLLHGAAMTEDKAPLSLRTGSLVAETSMTGGMNGIDRQK
jgi:hypothetical protein